MRATGGGKSAATQEGDMKTAAILLAIGAGIAFASPAQAQGKDPPGVNPTHFVCYRVSQ